MTQFSISSPLPLLCYILVVRGLQWRRHLTRSVAAVEILLSRPLLLAGVQPKGGHKHLQGDCGTLGLGMASLYEGKGQPTELQRRRRCGWHYAGRCGHRSPPQPTWWSPKASADFLQTGQLYSSSYILSPSQYCRLALNSLSTK